MESLTTEEILRNLRRRAGLSQQQVAQALGIDRSAYTYLENGATELKLDRLLRLAKLYGVGVDELLPEEVLSPAFAAARRKKEVTVAAVTSSEKSLLVMFRQLNAEQQATLLNEMTAHCRNRVTG